MTKQYVKPMI